MSQIKIKQVATLQTTLDAKALDTVVAKKANNLSDLTNITTARTNLSVYSVAEVDSLISGTSNARSVATIAARNALTDLSVTERIFVENDGDTKWALYLVTAIGSPNNGTNATFVKLADEDSLTNALSAGAIKTSYESNANTNAFTDGQQTKVNFITVTQSVNLDTMESQIATNVSNIATNVTNISTAQSTANAASTAASNAQTTANNALTTANAAEVEFNSITEVFTGITNPASTPYSLIVVNNVASGHHVIVSINGLTIQNTPNFGTTAIDFTVAFAIEPSDEIIIMYSTV
jgi:hypothetical protein